MRELEEIERTIANNNEAHTHTLYIQENEQKGVTTPKIKGVLEIENVRGETSLTTALFYTTARLKKDDKIKDDFLLDHVWAATDKLNAHTYKLKLENKNGRKGMGVVTADGSF